MSKESGTNNKDLEKALGKISEMESRISKLESILENSLTQNAGPEKKSDVIEVNFRRRQGKSENIPEKESEKEEGEFESKIGEYGMAWLGNIVLLVGIIFLIQFFKIRITTYFQVSSDLHL